MTTATSRITLCVSARARIALSALAVVGLVAGCGGDDEDEPDRPATAPPAATSPAPPVTTPPPETTVTPDERDPQAEPRTVPPEEQQGDEEPIRSEAVFTGKGGRLTPRVVRVPAYIAVRVILRSPDAGREQAYVLEIGGERLAIGHVQALAEAELPGLPPGRAYKGRSPQGDVRIVATAEPGP